MQERYYFDHNATTPLSSEVLQAFTAALENTPGNASSIHRFGQAAKQQLEQARRHVAAMLGANPKEIVFLSGGTEANNLALFGALQPGAHLLTTAIEHPAILNPAARLQELGVTVTYLAPDRDGVIHPDDVRRALTPHTTLISVMHANNETGVIQPIHEIGAIAREADALMHVDGVQAVGKLPLDLSHIDLYSISAHKLYAPKGIGALYVRTGVKLKAQMLGGHHERDRRAGTENVPAAVAFGRAAQWVTESAAAESQRLTALRQRLETGIRDAVPHITINGSSHRLPNTSNIRFDGIEGEAMVIALDLRGFAVSSGSACSSGAVEPSHVLLAMGLAPEDARSSVRFSLGRSNNEDQIDQLIQAVAASAHHLRRVSPVYSHA